MLPASHETATPSSRQGGHSGWRGPGEAASEPARPQRTVFSVTGSHSSLGLSRPSWRVCQVSENLAASSFPGRDGGGLALTPHSLSGSFIHCLTPLLKPASRAAEALAVPALLAQRPGHSPSPAARSVVCGLSSPSQGPLPVRTQCPGRRRAISGQTAQVGLKGRAGSALPAPTPSGPRSRSPVGVLCRRLGVEPDVAVHVEENVVLR